MKLGLTGTETGRCVDDEVVVGIVEPGPQPCQDLAQCGGQILFLGSRDISEIGLAFFGHDPDFEGNLGGKSAIILLLGYMLGNFLGRAALIAAVNAGMKISAPLGHGVRYLVYLLAVSMALEQLGIGKETVLVSFGIIFSWIVLSLAIAFGLGGKDAAREYLEKRLGEKEHEDDISPL